MPAPPEQFLTPIQGSGRAARYKNIDEIHATWSRRLRRPPHRGAAGGDFMKNRAGNDFEFIGPP